MPVIKCNGKDYAGSDMDIKSKIVTFESGDGPEPDSAAEVPLMESGGLMKSLMRSASLVARNTRYLLKMLGTTDISTMADGTLTGALKGLSDKKMDKDSGISLTGDVIGTSTFDSGMGVTEIQTKRRGCVIYHNSSSYDGAMYKVARIEAPIGTINDIHVLFSVFEVYSLLSDAPGKTGILHLNVRISSNTVSAARLIWDVAGSYISLGNFILAYKVEKDKAVAELYYVVEGSWAKYQISIINDTFSNLDKMGPGNLELYSWPEYSETAMIPTDYVQVPSTLAALKNPADRMTNMWVINRYYSGVKYATIKGRFADFNGNGGARQTVFIFGNANYESVLGNVIVDSAGNCSWSGIGSDVAVSVDKDSGRIRLTFPKTLYDTMMFISGWEISIAEPF